MHKITIFVPEMAFDSLVIAANSLLPSLTVKSNTLNFHFLSFVSFLLVLKSLPGN